MTTQLETAPLSGEPATAGSPPRGGRAPVARARRKRFRTTRPWVPWLFVAPFVLVFTVFTAIPGITSLTMSFTDIGARDLRDPLGVNFVGLETFARVLSDPTFSRSVMASGIFVVLTVPATMVLGFVLALILDSGIRRLRGLYRAAIYVPVVTNVVAAAMIWQYAFTPEGPLNGLFGSLGLPTANWLGEPTLAVPVVALLGIWRNLGIAMVLFLAGLQAIPTELKEAAQIDGAGYLRRLSSITIPLLRPTTLLVSVLMMVFFLNMFEEPYLVTGGGPLGSTRTISIWVFQQFGYGNIAPSMAGSFILLVIVCVVSAVQFRLLRSKH